MQLPHFDLGLLLLVDEGSASKIPWITAHQSPSRVDQTAFMAVKIPANTLLASTRLLVDERTNLGRLTKDETRWP